MKGVRVAGVLEEQGVRAIRVDVGAIAAHAAQVHGSGERAARLQEEALVVAALLSAYLDEAERLTLQLQLERPRMAFMADVGGDGSVRCRTSPPEVRPYEGLNGLMLVLKSVRGKEIYRGITEVRHPRLGDVLQEHLRTSIQAPAAVRIEGGIGLFCEALPGGEPSIDAALEAAWDGFDGEVRPLRWACTCSRERVLDMLAALGKEELKSMIEEDGGAVVDCAFCRERVEVSVDELERLVASA